MVTDKLEDSYWMCVHDSACIHEATTRATEILDADYKKVNVLDMIKSSSYLSLDEQSKLKTLLYKCKIFFMVL